MLVCTDSNSRVWPMMHVSMYIVNMSEDVSETKENTAKGTGRVEYQYLKFSVSLSAGLILLIGGLRKPSFIP